MSLLWWWCMYWQRYTSYLLSLPSLTPPSPLQLMDSDGNGKIDVCEFEAAFTESLPQHTRASVDEPRLPLLPKSRDESYAADGSSSSRRSARHVVAEMAVQVWGRGRRSMTNCNTCCVGLY